MNTPNAGDVRPAPKRTIDADKLYEWLEAEAKAGSGANEHALRIRTQMLNAAFPVAKHDPTHTLRPLPESEWPEAHKGKWHSGTKLFRLSDSHVLIQGGSSGMWMVNSRSNAPFFPDKHPTPAAALEAAGLPVELLEGLKRVNTWHHETVEAGNNPATAAEFDAEMDKIAKPFPFGTNPKPKVKLRVGMRVRHEKYGEGVIIVHANLQFINQWYVGFSEHADPKWLYASQLTPIQPPLIDNGDGTWTMDGYGMFRIVHYSAGFRWEYAPNGVAKSNGRMWEPTPEAAALDLFERMEGVR